ncbi:MAG TPA: hypothetical protein VMD51_12040 [Mycobacterium sp.]|nr:hypothetical protein [Mycobacterium sp.]
MVRGATIKEFLQCYGVPKQQAKQLWDMRQLMHGAIPFDSKKLENLGGLVQPLRAVVAAGLKIRLGKAIDEPPLVAATGFLIHPAMGLGGTRQITEDDIRPLVP